MYILMLPSERQGKGQFGAFISKRVQCTCNKTFYLKPDLSRLAGFFVQSRLLEM